MVFNTPLLANQSALPGSAANTGNVKIDLVAGVQGLSEMQHVWW